MAEYYIYLRPRTTKEAAVQSDGLRRNYRTGFLVKGEPPAHLRLVSKSEGGQLDAFEDPADTRKNLSLTGFQAELPVDSL